MQQLGSSILAPAHGAVLLQFFGGIPMPAKLIYRATRNGFHFDDWQRCCLGKGPTMTLVKAQESGFVFGAYSHCSWPENKDGGRVADLTRQSFLFSLSNAADKAVRFSLSNKNDAIGVESSGGVHFGLNGINFVLNVGGAASDGDRGNSVFPMDEFSAYQPDDKDFLCGVDFFAGSEFFAATDIEVYQL